MTKDAKSAPTLEDVARLASVSTATVSRSLNFPELVSDRTRERVQTAVDTLGYSPNFGARVMAAQRTRTIGAIIPTMENAVFAQGIQAFQEELDGRGYMLLVASSAYQTDLEEKQIRSLIARGADALLLIGYQRGPAITDFIKARNVPTLITWAFDAAKTDPTIGFDNRHAMRRLTEEVLQLGHRRIALIAAETDTNDRVAERVRGVSEAIQQAGLAANSLTIHRTRYGIETGAAGFEAVMGAPHKPTVVMCANDVLAVGAIKQAAKMGLSVPGDVSVTGFDDIELAQVTSPEIATVRIPHREMGRRAARSLIGLLEDGVPLESENLHTELCLRGSLGAVPAT
ncbi:LacI family DNA-binding transcriptional regulator [Gymnodinialimonas hymeniacidonis]|uniref:LacI family DNA-binding transcriptional regulator n=1 Tax=Gymnodinialimonas hymeniacidonis TaxID=3126508 RepID=UPI0034C5E659